LASAERPFRIALVDAHMPEMDGFQLIEQIAAQANGEKPAMILMLSSGDRPSDIRRSRELGVAEYLLKPIKQSELFDAIGNIFGERTLENEPSEAACPAHASRWGPLHILLAEDSLVNQKLAVGLLTRQGHDVTVVGTGRAALDAWENDAFDVVLMDVQMPEMDGLTAMREIRRREEARGRAHTPIISLTAHAMKGDRERCLDAGADEYISKPIQIRQFLDTLEKVLTPRPPAPAPAASTALEPALPEAVSLAPTNNGASNGALAAEAAVAVAEKPAASLDEQRMWDPVAAMRSVGGDRALLCELLESFLQEHPRLMANLRRAVETADAPRLQAAAHVLKGSIRCFHAPAAQDPAELLEAMGRENRLAGIEPLCEEVEQAYDRLAGALTRFLDQEVRIKPK
jgi:CheY-like chemotaxis protein/HPt (histidine-containing phosphotransfer) domain-containing protein